VQLAQAIVLVAVDEDDELGLRYVYVFVLFGWCCFGQEQDKWLCLFASVCNPPCSACVPHQTFARCPAPQPLLEWCRHGLCMPTLSVRICRPRLALPNLITAFWVVVATYLSLSPISRLHFWHPLLVIFLLDLRPIEPAQGHWLHREVGPRKFKSTECCRG